MFQNHTDFLSSRLNSLGAEVLYEKAREYIGDTNEKVVFDLYSGTGTICTDPCAGCEESGWCGDCRRSGRSSKRKCEVK